MTNSKNDVTVATKTVTKKITQPKNGNLSLKAEQSKKSHLNTTQEDKIFEIMAAEKELEETKAQLENIELENATLRANAKHSDTSLLKKLEATRAEAEKLKLENLEIKTLKEEKEIAKAAVSEAAKKAERLKTELEKAQTPTHTTTEEKLNCLKKANEISLMLKRRQDLFAAFKAATTGDEQDQFKIIFQSSNGANFELAKSEIVTTLTKIAAEYMVKTISETEQEFLHYQM